MKIIQNKIKRKTWHDPRKISRHTSRGHKDLNSWERSTWAKFFASHHQLAWHTWRVPHDYEMLAIERYSPSLDVIDLSISFVLVNQATVCENVLSISWIYLIIIPLVWIVLVTLTWTMLSQLLKWVKNTPL